jgi:hypothetical protein
MLVFTSKFDVGRSMFDVRIFFLECWEAQVIHLTAQSTGITFAVKVVPGASRDKIAGEYDGGLKVTVARPPQDGAANLAVIALLAKHLGISKDKIEITRGHTNPRKTVQVSGITAEELQARLAAK